jgi:hypothetical protein
VKQSVVPPTLTWKLTCRDKRLVEDSLDQGKAVAGKGVRFRIMRGGRQTVINRKQSGKSKWMCTSSGNRGDPDSENSSHFKDAYL